MKQIYTTLWILTLTSLVLSAKAQKNFTISANSNWSSVTIPSTCASCTITIKNGVTLTMDEAVTCQNCKFQGGTLAINNQTFNLQYSGSVTPTEFNGTNLLVSGNSAQVIVNAPLSLTNSTFTFNNSSTFTTSYEVDLSASFINLNDNASMTSTGGSSTMINLDKASKIVIGNGSQTSAAIFTVSGPTLNLKDNSSVTLGNQNNVFFDWASYDVSGSGSPKTFSTSGLSMNCGAGFAHSCANPMLYGPSTLSTSGVVSNLILPVVLTGFSAVLDNDHTITIDWATQEEVNSSHFSIERSADGSNWSEIGSVRAKGNSSMETDYTFSDTHPQTGMNYYRLNMVDLDNSHVYSEIKVVRTSAISQISFFPNPAHDFVNVSLGSTTGDQVTVLLTSASGQVLQAKKMAATAGTVVTFPVQNCAAGIYILSVIDADGTKESRPVLISK